MNSKLVLLAFVAAASAKKLNTLEVKPVDLPPTDPTPLDGEEPVTTLPCVEGDTDCVLFLAGVGWNNIEQMINQQGRNNNLQQMINQQSGGWPGGNNLQQMINQQGGNNNLQQMINQQSWPGFW